MKPVLQVKEQAGVRRSEPVIQGKRGENEPLLTQVGYELGKVAQARALQAVT